MTPNGVHTFTFEFDFGGRVLTVHPAAVETNHGLVLLDVGLPGATDQLRDALGDAGLDLADVSMVVLTHHDGDHAAGLAELADETRLIVATHRGEAPYVDGRRHPVKAAPDDERFPPVPVDLELTGGETFHTDAGPMRVVETPGHSPGHVSLYFPDHRFLVAGDAMTNDNGGADAFGGPKPQFTPELDQAVESVGRLAELDIETTHCYHGGTADAGTDDIAAIHAERRR
ncbi:MBL fold metallo-hydrolase [Haloarchaeobius iranensis]|uniref:Glyoxylase, beta-lactamase superfamily II n=1 Tax=Haloarchaeobius iranensis TaxID=996166 RepID=A0A1G9U2H3_9EURY|nr:MBL fold metallo-hydrolase [Haloarchaeobius iranensis]SDM54091.1 Glyoxylase, beta-lactamase superfamily II [Haloarchaeobius iranensis]